MFIQLLSLWHVYCTFLVQFIIQILHDYVSKPFCHYFCNNLLLYNYIGICIVLRGCPVASMHSSYQRLFFLGFGTNRPFVMDYEKAFMKSSPEQYFNELGMIQGGVMAAAW